MAPHFPEGGVVVAEVIEGAFGNDAPLMEDIDIVEAGEEMEAVDRGDDGLVGESFKKSLIDHGFRAGVYAAGWLVQQDEIAISGGEDAAGECQPLFLAAGEVDALL